MRSVAVTPVTINSNFVALFCRVIQRKKLRLVVCIYVLLEFVFVEKTESDKQRRIVVE